MIDASMTCGRHRSATPRSSSGWREKEVHHEDRYRLFRYVLGGGGRAARHGRASARRDHRRPKLARIRGRVGRGVLGEGTRGRAAAERIASSGAHPEGLRHRRRGDSPRHGRRAVGRLRGGVRPRQAGAPSRSRACGEHAHAVRAPSGVGLHGGAAGRTGGGRKGRPRDAACPDRYRSLLPHSRRFRLPAPRRAPHAARGDVRSSREGVSRHEADRRRYAPREDEGGALVRESR